MKNTVAVGVLLMIMMIPSMMMGDDASCVRVSACMRKVDEDGNHNRG